MNKMMLLLAVCLAWSVSAAAAEDIPPKTHPDSKQWDDLFKADLSDAIFPKGVWYYEGGLLTATKDENIWTKKEYRNCIIDLEFKNAPGTNSGVFVYGSDLKNWVPNSVEIQILDDYSPKWSSAPKTWLCAGIFGRLAPSKQVVKKAGEWNRMTVTCQGPKLYVLLNGEQVTQIDMRKWTSAKNNPDGSDIPPWLSKPLAELPTHGHIGLQGKHAGAPIYFRNIKIKTLDDTPVPANDERPAKIWNREGPLGETPTRITDAYPLSDQQNKGGWIKFEPMSDEFKGKDLDRNKWVLGIGGWKGRQPGLFSEKNVTVSDGKLRLTMRKEKLPPEMERLGYHDYTSAALHSKVRSSYGYYEVKAKPMDSGGSSSFWFHNEGQSDWATEIDVFEIGGKAKGFERKVNITLHVWQTPKEKKHWQVGGAWSSPWRLADDYHVYGFDWGKDDLRFYVDGVLVRSVENTHWRQPLLLTFDSETMPDWMGMPKDEDLPSTFNIEYVRAWKKK